MLGRRVATRKYQLASWCGAAVVDDFEVTDLGTLTFSDEVPAQCDVFGTLLEADFFGKCDGRFAVLVNDLGRCW